MESVGAPAAAARACRSPRASSPRGRSASTSSPRLAAAASGAAAAAGAAAALPEALASRVARARRAPPMRDALWDWLAEAGGGSLEPHWGSVLDAGTGVESLRWVATLACDWDQTVAVTASQPMRDRMLRELGEEAAMEGRLGDILVCHNWSRIQGEGGGGDKGGSSASSSDAGAHGDGPGADVSGVKANNGGGEVGVQPAVSRAMGQFDTVLADYLFGSLEYFWPYSEERLMDLLCERVARGGQLLFVGREPYAYPSSAWRGLPSAVRLVLETERLRDGCMVLSHQRAYREFPEQWAKEALRRRGFRVKERTVFRSKHTPKSLELQLSWAESEARRVPDAALAQALLKRVAAVRQEARGCGELQGGYSYGRNYALVAVRERDPQQQPAE